MTGHEKPVGIVGMTAHGRQRQFAADRRNDAVDPMETPYATRLEAPGRLSLRPPRALSPDMRTDEGRCDR
jgi:hypothetical protein